jgi:hypothetical protein
MFPQGKYAQAQGIALNLTAIGAPCVTGASECPRYRFHARRSREVFTIWANVFGPQLRHRLRFVLSTWTISAPATREILAFEGAYKWADFVGVTGYLGAVSKVTSAWSAKSMLQVFEELYAALNSTESSFQGLRAAAAQYNLTLISYEAGPGLVQDGVIGGGGATGAVTELLVAAARNNRMEPFYREGIRALRRANVSAGRERPLMAFSSSGPFSKFGSWGHLEYTRQPPAQAPKYRAVQRAIEDSTAGSLPRATLPAACFDPSLAPWGLGDNVFIGPPAVASPAAGDRWIAGKEYTVVWDAEGAAAGSQVGLTLWRTASCPGLGGAQVAVISLRAPDTGRLLFTVPAGLPPRADYFVRVEKPGLQYFSELFSVVRNYEYVAGPWGNCSAKCGYGLRRREIQCRPVLAQGQELAMGASIKVVAATSSCLRGDQALPPPQRQYNQWTKNWEVMWVNGTLASHWAMQPDFLVGGCALQSTSCRQYRTARHNKEARYPPPYPYGNFKPVDDCTALHSVNPRSPSSTANAGGCDALDTQPPTSKVCFERPCGDFAWVVGVWDDCSAPCGGGLQERTVTCMDSTGAQATPDSCLGAGLGLAPVTSQTCNTVECPAYEWAVAGEWGPCSAWCGPGVRSRSVSCLSSTTRAVVSSSLCPAATRPTNTLSCNSPCASTYWSASAWSSCTAACSGGLRSRQVKCMAGGTAVANSTCASIAPPVAEEECNTGPCETVGWAVGKWEQCSASCGGGRMTRTVQCVGSIRGALPQEACASSSPPPPAESPCGLEVCDPCSAQPPCNSHGSCGLGGKICICEAGYSGADCTQYTPCPLPAVLDRSGACCNGLRDINGDCCNGGRTLDACGVCGGTAVMVDVLGACCSGVLDGSGRCCMQTLDVCSVCGGDSTSCATGLNFRLAMNTSLVGTDFSELRSNFTLALQERLAAAIGKDLESVAITGISTSVPSAATRRLLDSGGGVEVQAILLPDGSTSAGTVSLSPNSSLGNFTVLSVQQEATGMCGNAVCEQGERCDVDSTDGTTCCAADCRFSLSSCPTVAGDTLPCGGHGVCLPGSGQCSCYSGSAGSACEIDVLAWEAGGGATTETLPAERPYAMGLTWESLVASKVAGKGVHTGGLGLLETADYKVWLCLDPVLVVCSNSNIQGTGCGGGVGGLECFKFHEGLGRFEWWGSNSDLQII